jgi:hypothetical protein
VATTARQTLRSTLTVAALATALAVPAVRAGATPAPYFTDTKDASVAVKGSYVPVVGRFSRPDMDDIIWYSTPAKWGGPASTDFRWSPCQGCQSGPFTKTTLAPQVAHDYSGEIVGDFAGDDLDDIIWVSMKTGGQSFLWTNDAETGFSSTLIDLSGVTTDDWTVLRDSQTGSGSKDDLLWSRQSHSPWYSELWVFPDDGSVLPDHQVFRQVNGVMTGDFDGNGAVDLMDLPNFPTCDRSYGPCSAAGMDSSMRYDRRPFPQTATTFSSTQEVHDAYQPVVGHFEGPGDTTDDIVWVGGWGTIDRGQTWPPYTWTDGPDGIWLGQSSGHFAKGRTSIPVIDVAMVLHRDDGDAIYFPNIGKVWRLVGGSPTLSSMPRLGGPALPGRFISPDREDLFLYRPGSTAEHLLHPVA